jgi:hypothetical protein
MMKRLFWAKIRLKGFTDNFLKSSRIDFNTSSKITTGNLHFPEI